MTAEELLSVLEIKEASDWEAVQRQFRKLLRLYHPDVHRDNKRYFEEKTKAILNAYELLQEHFPQGIIPEAPQARESPAPSTTDSFLYLSFQVCGALCAFPIHAVQEVVEGKHFADEDRFIGRVRTREGDVHAFSMAFVLSLKKTHFTSPSPVKKIIVAACEGKRAGFLVDQVDCVVNILQTEFVDFSAFSPLYKFTHRVAARNGKMIFVLSPDKVFKAL